MPITIGRAFVNQALNIMQEDDLVHFDFRCPKCKKANRVSHEQLLHAAPAWKYEPTGKTEEKVETKTKPKPKTEPKAKPKPTPTAEPKAEIKVKPKPKTEAKAKPKPKAKPKTGAKAKPKPKSKK